MVTAVMTAAYGEDPAPADAGLTLDQCRSEARAHYPELAMTPILEQTRDLTLRNITTTWFPQIIVGGHASWQNRVAHFSGDTEKLLGTLGIDVPGLRKDQYHVGAVMHQNIWDGGASQAARRMTRAETDAQLRKVDADLYAVDGRVDQLFFGILLAQEMQKEIGLTLTLLDSNLHTVQIYYKDGVAMLADVDAVKAQKLQVGQAMKDAQAAEATLRALLGVFMGRDVSGAELVRPSAPSLSDGTCTRPELLTFAARDRALDAKRAAVTASLMPRVGLFAGAVYGYPGLDLIKDMMQRKWSFNFMVGVGVSWNIGAFYTRGNDLNKIKLGQRAVDVERQGFLFGVSLDKERSNGEINRLRALLADDAEIVELRKAVRNAAESKLRNGVIDTNDLLQKITDESLARQGKTNHEIELLRAQYELQHTVGGGAAEMKN